MPWFLFGRRTRSRKINRRRRLQSCFFKFYFVSQKKTKQRDNSSREGGGFGIYSSTLPLNIIIIIRRVSDGRFFLLFILSFYFQRQRLMIKTNVSASSSPIHIIRASPFSSSRARSSLAISIPTILIN